MYGQSQWLGSWDYEKALDLQDETFRKVCDKDQGVILGLEHPQVLTLGLRGNKKRDLLDSSFNIPTVNVRRGGEATIHNPGQLVIYPILPLQAFRLSVKDFVCVLLKTTKKLFADYDVVAFEKGEPGLYTERGKIVFVGLQVVKGVTRHGLAINVHNDLGIFEKISVCGVQGQPLDRLGDHGVDGTLEFLFHSWVRHFEKELADFM